MTTDIWLAIAVCAFVAIMFSVSLLVPRNVRPTRSTDVKLDDVARRFEDMEGRLKTAEHDIRNVRMAVGGLATKDSVTQVSLQVAEMRGDMKGMMSSVSTTQHSVGRIEDFLIKSSAEAIAATKQGAETKV